MNEITRQEIGPNQMANRPSVVESRPYEQVLNEERIGGIFGEALAWLRDDRVNTMRAISSDAASRKMVQKQNHELLTACSTTLQREGPNLTIEQQLSLIDKMRGAAASTERTDAELLADKELQGNVIEHAGDVYANLGEMETALRFWKLAKQKKDNTCTPLLRKKIKRKKYIK